MMDKMGQTLAPVNGTKMLTLNTLHINKPIIKRNTFVNALRILF